MSELIDRLDRRYQQLRGQQDNVAFLRGIETYLAALDHERGVRKILKQLRRERKREVKRFRKTESSLIKEAEQIRRDLVVAAPEIDNSGAVEPPTESQEHMGWTLDSFANFNRLAQRRDEPIEFAPLPSYDTNDRTPLGTMLIILRGRLQAAQYGEMEGHVRQLQVNHRPDLDDFNRRIGNLQEKHSHALNQFKAKQRSLAGLADARLRVFVDALDLEPLLIEEDEDEEELLQRMFRRGMDQFGVRGIMRTANAGLDLSAGQQEVFDDTISFLRGELERLHEEVVHRLSTRRRVLATLGLGSYRLGKWVAGVVVATAIGAIVTAYAANWFPGQDDKSKSPPAVTTTTTSH